MQAMMTPALPQITWQHCTHPVEATDLQIPEEGAHEAGTLQNAVVRPVQVELYSVSRVTI